MRIVAIGLVMAACTDPVVEMHLLMPSNVESFDTSCVSAVGVMVAGANYASDFNDYTWSCREITAQDRLTGIHDAIRGTFDLKIPETGMAGVELFGWSGPQPCAPPEFVSPDLIFHASAPYIGQDILDLRIETTLDCAKQPVKVRPVELFTLLGGATPSATNCAAAAIPDEDLGWATLGVITRREFTSGVEFYGGFRGADVTGGVASFSAATTGTGKSCLAYDASSTEGYATACAMGGARVCAGADEIDAPFVNRDISAEALTLDEALLARWDSMVFVSVWDNGNPRRPVAGATIDIAAADGAVVYVDAPTAGTALSKRDGATGASGLAVVYTNKLANVKVTANGATRDVTVAAPDWSVGAALVAMP